MIRMYDEWGSGGDSEDFINNSPLEIMFFIPDVIADDVEKFFESNIKDNPNVKGCASASWEFLENFKPFPKEWEDVRDLIFKVKECTGCVAYDFNSQSPDHTLILNGDKEDGHINEDLVELVLDVVENHPYLGVSKNRDGSVELTTAAYPDMKLSKGHCAETIIEVEDDQGYCRGY